MDDALFVAPPVDPGAQRRAEAIDFILDLGLALHAAGTPSHRLEDVMQHVSSAFKLEGQFFAVPTSLQVFFRGQPPSPQAPQGRAPQTYMLRTQPGGIDLGQLARIDAVAQAAAGGHLHPIDGVRELASLRREQEAYNATRRAFASTLTAGGFVSGAAALLLGGGTVDAVVALILGIVVILTGHLFRKSSRAIWVSDLFSTVVCVFGATLFSRMLPVRVDVVSLAALISLVPGFTLTVGLTELATHHLVSGTAKLCAAGIVFLQMTVGYAAGARLGGLLPEVLSSPSLVAGVGIPTALLASDLAIWIDLVGLVVAGVGLTVLLKARAGATGWIVLAMALAVYAARAASPHFGPELAAGVGALSVGVFANLYSRSLQRPATEILSPAVLLLVPGTIGLTGLQFFLRSDVEAGVQGMFTMSMVAASIVVGLLTANALVPPRRLL